MIQKEKATPDKYTRKPFYALYIIFAQNGWAFPLMHFVPINININFLLN